MEDAKVRTVEGWGCWFRVGDGFGSGMDVVLMKSGRAKGIVGIDGACDWEDWGQGWGGNGILQGEGGFDSALPEAGEEHKEETELG